jgi:hypothetical protein
MVSSLGGFFTAADGLGASLLSLGGGAGYLVDFGGGLALAPSLQLGIARMQRSGLSGRSEDAIGFLLYPAVDVRYALDRSLDLGLGLGPQTAWNGRWHVVNMNLLVSVSFFLGSSRD